MIHYKGQVQGFRARSSAYNQTCITPKMHSFLKKNWISGIIIVFLFFANDLAAQQLFDGQSVPLLNDTISISTSLPDLKSNQKNFSYKMILMPAALIAYGAFAKNDQIEGFNRQIREELTENIDEKFSIDDFGQYAPATAVYGLNLCGIKSKHDFAQRSLILATSYAIVSVSVLTLKSASHVERPDRSSNNSFPSGHTATAFAGAEFLWQEYKDESIWYGVGGYALAAGVGAFRMFNNRHWLTDVAAGAGIGILSTKVAYWLYPYVSHLVFRDEKKISSSVAPYYDGRKIGCVAVVTFN